MCDCSLFLLKNKVDQMARRTKKEALTSTKSAPSNDPRILLPDPEWCDIEPLPNAERYTRFNPTKAFRNSMLADRSNWPPADSPVTIAIANVMSDVVMPRFVSLEQWCAHAAEFFRRLCNHRKAMHSQIESSFQELQSRYDELRVRHDEQSNKIVELDKRVRHLEQQSMPPLFPPRSSRNEDTGNQRGRSPSVPHRILFAQLAAVRARSPSLGADALKALAEFDGTDATPLV